MLVKTYGLIMWCFHLIHFSNPPLSWQCLPWKCYVQNLIKYQKKISLIILIISSKLSCVFPSPYLFLCFSFSFSLSFFFLSPCFCKRGNIKSWAVVRSSNTAASGSALQTARSCHVTAGKPSCIARKESSGRHHCLIVFHCSWWRVWKILEEGNPYL